MPAAHSESEIQNTGMPGDDDRFERLEHDIDRLEKALKDTRQLPWHFRIGDLTAALAVIGLIWTASKGYSVTEHRVAQMEKGQMELRGEVAKVPEFGWKIDGLARQVGEMERRQGETATKVTEVHEALIRMGVNVKPGK